MRSNAHSADPSLLDTLKILTAVFGALFFTRLELMRVDLEEARERAATQLIWLLATLFCLGVGVVLLVLLIIIAMWNTQRLAVLGGLAGLFLSGGLLAVWEALRQLQTQPALFRASLSAQAHGVAGLAPSHGVVPGEADAES